jgi:hypothetical protein
MATFVLRCEARLAAFKVRPYIRAQVQSHGLTGVQAMSYDMRDYYDEKLDALEQLAEVVGVS